MSEKRARVCVALSARGGAESKRCRAGFGLSINNKLIYFSCRLGTATFNFVLGESESNLNWQIIDGEVYMRGRFGVEKKDYV